MQSYNCIICANEFSKEDLLTEEAIALNKRRYKICQACLETSNPESDFADVKNIIDSYVKFAYEIEIEEDL